MFWQQVISGAAAGSIYALLAVAMVLIYKTTNIVNFAQGEMAMFTTFISYTFLIHLGRSYVVSLGLTLILSAVVRDCHSSFYSCAPFGKPLALTALS